MWRCCKIAAHKKITELQKLCAVRDAAYQALIEAARFDAVRRELSISVCVSLTTPLMQCLVTPSSGVHVNVHGSVWGAFR